VRGGNKAIEWARKHLRWPAGYCLQWVRMCFDVAARYYDANEGWRNAQYKHRTSSGQHCPRGVPVWWTNSTHGHVALSVGDGYCINTDAGGAGVCARVKIDDLTRRWGLRFEGWSEDINGVRVYNPKAGEPAAGWERVRPSAVQLGKRNKDVEVVARRLVAKLGDKHGMDLSDRWKDYFGRRKQAAYREWQERLGFDGPDADGIPGPYSLRKLGLEVVDG
jgi:hypothetical protein